ncbi:hypothetical protein H257_16083 [Aphanomyces astaci]|uniref:DUF7769 domain-containing protein n=1 Tax=Aphanomyces astaci TaxID=112090 RepID=W4FJN4_APHAT|nr:hypothetical protein H257_16083 [Aphanomyces astaci]ETV67722.1 hypothetical protein H257_16083 [Aphanomyces astaci]|eukprot:XP_009842715.1 hypothetical protein H257_16083 [Aphanomyces astaci]
MPQQTNMSPKVASAVAPARVRGKKHLTLAQRHRIYELLLEICVQGELHRGAMLYVAQQFQCDSRIISHIWSRGRASSRNGRGVADIASKIPGNSGRKRTRSVDEIEAATRQVHQESRQTMRALAFKSGTVKLH